MSDLLLIGRAPSTSEGNEYFLHCMDWWWAIYNVVETLLTNSFPVEELFYRDSWLAPPTLTRAVLDSLPSPARVVTE